MNTIQKLSEKNLITPPKFVADSICYETIMGSVAYGCSSDTSDMDIYGFCVPPKEVVFPHLAGDIQGFGREKQGFEQFQEHHIFSKDELSGKGRTYDVAIYNIVRYFHLCMMSNPNMLDSLFTKQDSVLHCNQIGNMVRDNRHLFLCKLAWHKYKGYAYSQLHKMQNKKNATGKRKEYIDKFGFDVKFAYHLVRLLDEVEQILTEEDIDIKRNREHLKAIRRGEVSEQDILKWAADKEKQLETAYTNSSLPHKPREAEIKTLLVNCLEHHFGDLSGFKVPGGAVRLLRSAEAKIREAITCIS